MKYEKRVHNKTQRKSLQAAYREESFFKDEEEMVFRIRVTIYYCAWQGRRQVVNKCWVEIRVLWDVAA